jgi:hypothetical protein
MTVILLNSVDVSDYCVGNNYQFITSKSEPGQILLNPAPTLTGINTEGFWNPNDPVSVFYGLNDYSDYIIDLYYEEDHVFTGFVESIEINTDSTATIGLQSYLQAALDKNIVYSNIGNPVSPAQLFIDVCEYYNIPYDPLTANYSKMIYEENNVLVQSVILDPTTTILSFLEVLSMIGVASIYSVSNKLYFQVFERTELNPAVILENTYDNNKFYLLDRPKVSNIEKDKIEGYSVTYYDTSISKEDQTYSYGSQTNAFTLTGGQADLVTITTLQGAIWLAEYWLDYLDYVQTRVDVNITSDLGRQMKLGYPFRLDMKDGTDPTNYITSEINIENDVLTRLVGVSYE